MPWLVYGSKSEKKIQNLLEWPFTQIWVCIRFVSEIIFQHYPDSFLGIANRYLYVTCECRIASIHNIGDKVHTNQTQLAGTLFILCLIFYIYWIQPFHKHEFLLCLLVISYSSIIPTIISGIANRYLMVTIECKIASIHNNDDKVPTNHKLYIYIYINKETMHSTFKVFFTHKKFHG